MAARATGAESQPDELRRRNVPGQENGQAHVSKPDAEEKSKQKVRVAYVNAAVAWA